MIDPASSFLLGHAAGKLLDKVGDSFRTHVIDRWSRRRAEAFFQEFCDAMKRQQGALDDDAFAADLTRLVEDEVCSEVLFDAYRRVALSRSRDLGPRIVALLTAELIAAGRIANDTEDALFSAAETLTDEELSAFARFVREQQRTPGTRWLDGGLRIRWADEQFDSNWKRQGGVSTAPLDLNDALGRWAAKLKVYGIVQDDVQEREFDYQADSERHVDNDGHVREVSWWVQVPISSIKLVELIEEASASAAREAGDVPRDSLKTPRY